MSADANDPANQLITTSFIYGFLSTKNPSIQFRFRNKLQQKPEKKESAHGSARNTIAYSDAKVDDIRLSDGN